MTDKEFELVYKGLYRPLRFFANNLIRDLSEAEGIVDESMTKLYHRKDGFDFNHQEKITNFLYQVTRNACYDFLKHKKILKKHLGEQTEMPEWFIEEVADMDEPVWPLESTQPDIDIMMRASHELPLIRRRIFELLHIRGLDTKRVSEILGIPMDTVRVQKGRIKAHMKAALS